MIDVELEKREQSHPALEHAMWFGRRGRFWDFDQGFIEADTPGNKHRLDHLENCLDWMVDELVKLYDAPEIKELIKDYEICGSYAYGNHRYWSDMDIQLSTGNERKQEQLHNIFLTDVRKFTELVMSMSYRMRLNLDIRHQSHDQKEKSECYSLRKRKLYNREPLKAKPANYKRRWDKEKKSYEPVTLEDLPESRGPHWDDNGDELDALR